MFDKWASQNLIDILNRENYVELKSKYFFHDSPEESIYVTDKL